MLHFPQLRLEHVVYPVPPLLGVEVYAVPGAREVIDHAQHVFQIHESQLAGVAPYQTASHLVPPGHVTIQKIRNLRAHLRVLWYRA